MKEFTDKYLNNVIEKHLEEIRQSINTRDVKKIEYWITKTKTYLNFYKEHSDDLFNKVRLNQEFIHYNCKYLAIIK